MILRYANRWLHGPIYAAAPSISTADLPVPVRSSARRWATHGISSRPHSSPACQTGRGTPLPLPKGSPLGMPSIRIPRQKQHPSRCHQRGSTSSRVLPYVYTLWPLLKSLSTNYYICILLHLTIITAAIDITHDGSLVLDVHQRPYRVGKLLRIQV